MRMGVHREVFAESLALADRSIIYQPENLDWDVSDLQSQDNNIKICISIDEIMHELQQEVAPNSHFLLMSNGSFGVFTNACKMNYKLHGTIQ